MFEFMPSIIDDVGIYGVIEIGCNLHFILRQHAFKNISNHLGI